MGQEKPLDPSRFLDSTKCLAQNCQISREHAGKQTRLKDLLLGRGAGGWGGTREPELLPVLFLKQFASEEILT